MPSATATASATTLRLSDTIDLTLTAKGEAPLRVELPKDLLEPASAAVWQIEPVGTATVTPDGTAWTRHYRLSPFLPGEHTLKFNPIKVNGTDATPESLTFKVETALRNPTAGDARPVTGVEQLPPTAAAEPPLVLAGVSLLLALIGVLVVALVVARRRKPKPLAPGEWVREQFARLRAARLPEPEFVERLAGAFREYLARRFGLNTEQATTAELLAAADAKAVWDADARRGVEHLLGECDAVKFAGRVPTAADCDALAERAGGLVERWEREPAGSPRI